MRRKKKHGRWPTYFSPWRRDSLVACTFCSSCPGRTASTDAGVEIRKSVASRQIQETSHHTSLNTHELKIKPATTASTKNKAAHLQWTTDSSPYDSLENKSSTSNIQQLITQQVHETDPIFHASHMPMRTRRVQHRSFYIAQSNHDSRTECDCKSISIMEECNVNTNEFTFYWRSKSLVRQHPF